MDMEQEKKRMRYESSADQLMALMHKLQKLLAEVAAQGNFGYRRLRLPLSVFT